jgi:hypothetical protein
MELQVIQHEAQDTQDEREWELADEDLDRAERSPICSTSRPCTCSRCACR